MSLFRRNYYFAKHHNDSNFIMGAKVDSDR